MQYPEIDDMGFAVFASGTVYLDLSEGAGLWHAMFHSEIHGEALRAAFPTDPTEGRQAFIVGALLASLEQVDGLEAPGYFILDADDRHLEIVC
jgi:hypothetical protein